MKVLGLVMLGIAAGCGKDAQVMPDAGGLPHDRRPPEPTPGTGLPVDNRPPPEPGTGLCAGITPASTVSGRATCAPELLMQLPAVRALAIDERDLYFIDTEYELWRASKTGTAPSRLSSPRTTALALGPTHVYWATQDEGVFAQPKEGGAATEIAPPGTIWHKLTVAGEHLYLVDYDGKQVERLAMPNGAPAPVLVLSQPSQALVISAGWIYIQTTTGVDRVPARGGVPERVVGLSGGVLIGADEGYLYAEFFSRGSVVARTPVGGGCWERLESFDGPVNAPGCGGTQPRMTVLHGEHLYRIAGNVTRLPKAGGRWSLFADGCPFDNDEHVAVHAFDGTHIYWHPEEPRRSCL